MSLPASFDLRGPNGKTISIPSVGFGTWASGNTSWAEESILTALKEGYRHLDCAWSYGVDGAVGNAIKRSGIPRDEIFITSKFWPHFGRPDNVKLCLDKCLKGMGVEYVDLWLAHWPMSWIPATSLESAQGGPDKSPEEMGQVYENGKPVIDWEHTATHICKLAGKEGSYVRTWKAMEDCVRGGKAKTIGLSNFSITEIEELLPYVSDIPISCNQVEVHPWLPQNDMLDFCHTNGILVTCYSPFAGQKEDGTTLLKDARVKELAEQNGMDVGQLLQSWAVQRGTIPLGKSQTPARIKSNLAVRQLSTEDMEALNQLQIPNDEGRTIVKDDWGVSLFQN